MQLNFVKEGRGPIVVLSHALGGDLSMWDEVSHRLASDYTVVRYDHRGHGKSELVPGPYGIDDMADDAAALIQKQAGGAVHFIGMSMGGMVAQQLAARHPQLVTSIVVANASSYYDEVFRAAWKARIETVRSQGMEAIADGVMQKWFTPEFRAHPDGAKRVSEMRRVLQANDPKAYIDGCEAVSRIDFRGTNPRIACPALVIAGTRDESTPPAMAEAIRNSISGAKLVTLPTAHLSAVERPAEFASLAVEFIRGVS